MLTRMLAGTIGVAGILTLLISSACSQSVHTKEISSKTLELLQNKFVMSDLLAMVKTVDNPKSSKIYFESNSNRFKPVGTQEQGEMRVEGYSVLDISSPIIGYSLYYHKASGSLVIVDASINPLNKEAMQISTVLIKDSFDLVAAGEGSKLYFLGIYNLNSQKHLKIILRETKAPMGHDYAIRYAISSK